MRQLLVILTKPSLVRCEAGESLLSTAPSRLCRSSTTLNSISIRDEGYFTMSRSPGPAFLKRLSRAAFRPVSHSGPAKHRNDIPPSFDNEDVRRYNEAFGAYGPFPARQPSVLRPMAVRGLQNPVVPSDLSSTVRRGGDRIRLRLRGVPHKRRHFRPTFTLAGRSPVDSIAYSLRYTETEASGRV
jgi:hypothetical protein